MNIISDRDVIIRQSRYKLMLYAICLGLMLIVATVEFFSADSQLAQNPVSSAIIFIIFFSLWFHFVIRSIRHKTEIILNKAGIDIRSIGFFNWEMLSSFSILRYVENGEVDLVLHLKHDLKDVKFPIQTLEQNMEELKNIIIEVSGRQSEFLPVTLLGEKRRTTLYWQKRAAIPWYRNASLPAFANTFTLAASNFDTLIVQKTLFTLILLFLIGCKDRAKQIPSSSLQDTSIYSVGKNDTLPKNRVVSEPERKQIRKEIEEQERNDSIQLSQVLNKALLYADKNKGKSVFQYRFEMFTEDSSIYVETNLSYGYLLSKDNKHLLVKRTVPWGVISTMFLLKEGNFKKIFEIEPLANTYIDDTLQDINGDGYKDFIVHTYSVSGCCRRNVYNTFLYFPKSGDFTSGYRFMNPTFSPNEKIIRGVGYGHPGEVGLYKYKWNGLRIDTIEFIYPYHNKKGQFIKTRKQEYLPTNNEGIVLKSLPNEYQKNRKYRMVFRLLRLCQQPTSYCYYWS